MTDWFDTGPYVPEPLTKRQHDYLKNVLQNQHDRLLELLSDEERVALELMGAEEWLTVLSKWSATELIGAIQDGAVAERARKRSVKTAREAAKKDPSPAHRKSAEVKTRRKWGATGV